MKTITKINLNTNKAEEIALFNSQFTRKLDSMGLDPKDVMIKVCAETAKDAEAEAYARSILTNMVAEGYVLNGNVYRPFMAGASDARKATSTWLREDVIPELGKWAMCGLQTKNMKLAINKYMAYIGLLSSASKPFADVFGKALDIRRVAVIKDISIKNKDFVDLVDGIVKHNVEREAEICAFDGFGIINYVVTKGESVTIRGPWLKAFVQAVRWDELAKLGVEFKDFWGNTIQLQNVDMVITESCFKTVKLYESWAQYCNAFEALGHEISVCVREHAPKAKGLPYQQGQTLMGTSDDALHFVAHAKRTVYKYHETQKAAGLLGGAQAKAAKLYPALFNESYTAKAVQEKYTTKRNDMLGGRIPELGFNAFLAPDLTAFIEYMFGLEIKGSLKAGECSCSTCKEGLVDVTRNPHLDNAHCLLNNVGRMSFVNETPTMFINIWDFVTLRLRADYDGDHVWFSQDEALLDLVNRTYEKLSNLPVDWDVAKAEKVQITRSAIAGFIVNLIHGSEIGLYADALTKMWNNAYDRDVCAWLTWAGNVLIDAAKHAAVKIEKPEAVMAIDKLSLPMFAMYAKADAQHPANTEYWTAPRTILTKMGPMTIPPRCKYTDSFLDKYSKGIQENIPETLTIDGIEDLIFDSTKMMIDAHRKIGRFFGLSKKGRYDQDLKTMVDCGLFQEIAFRHSTEWNKLVGQTSFFQNRREWEEETAKAARAEIIAWAHAQYPEIAVSDEKLEDACYDIIVRNIFNTKYSEGMDTVIKQCFWRVYGDKAVEVLKKNLAVNHDLPDFDSEEFADLFDDEIED